MREVAQHGDACGRPYLEDKENLWERHLACSFATKTVNRHKYVRKRQPLRCVFPAGSLATVQAVSSEHVTGKLLGKGNAAGLKGAAIPILVNAYSRDELPACDDANRNGAAESSYMSSACTGACLPATCLPPQSDPLSSVQPGQEGNLASKSEAKKQICFDYTKGVCKRGSSCKYSHDMEEIVRVNSQERGVCFDFLRNTCQRGLLCRFSHDLSNIISQGQNVKQGKKNAPICYDWVKGTCKREDCRYSHDIFSIISGKSASSRSATPEICYDFTRGKCMRGPSCRYSHDISRLTAGAFDDAEDGLQPSFKSQVAVATVAAQQAQLAVYTAAVMEANRRQSAPGSLQIFTQPGLPVQLGALPGTATSNSSMQLPGGAFFASQPEQLPQNQQTHEMQPWMMHMQAQQAWLQRQAPLPGMHSGSYTSLQARPQLPVWEHLAPEQQQALRAVMEAAQRSEANGRRPSPVPFEPASQPEPRRHTYDGASRSSTLQQNRLLEQLQHLSLSQLTPSHKLGGFAEIQPNLKAAAPPSVQAAEAGIPAVRSQATALMAIPHLLPPTLPQVATAVGHQPTNGTCLPPSDTSSALLAAAAMSTGMQMPGISAPATQPAASLAAEALPASAVQPTVSLAPVVAGSACQPTPLAAEGGPYRSQQLAFCQEIWRQ